MYSQLFRRETARRLRLATEQIVDAYLTSRFSWLDAFTRPNRDGLRSSVASLADSIEVGDPAGYCAFAADYLERLIQNGVSPVVILAAGDVFEKVALGFLTPDQRDVAAEIFDQNRSQAQTLVYERVIELRGA